MNRVCMNCCRLACKGLVFCKSCYEISKNPKIDAISSGEKISLMLPQSTSQLDWETHTSTVGRTFYYNIKTQVSTWEQPEELKTGVVQITTTTESDSINNIKNNVIQLQAELQEYSSKFRKLQAHYTKISELEQEYENTCKDIQDNKLHVMKQTIDNIDIVTDDPVVKESIKKRYEKFQLDLDVTKVNIDILKSIPRVKITEQGTYCNICMEQHPTLRVGTCGHPLCNVCLNSIGNRKCPTCRKRIENPITIYF